MTSMKLIKAGKAKKPYKCRPCEGSGEIEDNGPKVCRDCGGNGYIDPDWFFPPLKSERHD